MILICLFVLCISTQPSYAKISYGGGYGNQNVAPVILIANADIFNSSQAGANPFKTIKQGEFADIIHASIMKSDMIIIFSENNLCVEDISAKDDKGTPFLNLRKTLLEKKARYYPSVQTPYSILEQMLAPLHTNTLSLRNVDTNFKLPADQKHFYILFEDGVNETRTSTLRRHDAVLTHVWHTAMEQSKGVVCAIYTGKANQMYNKLKLRPRVIHSPTDDQTVLVVSEKARFRFGSVKLASMLRTRAMVGRPEIAEETWNRQKLSTRMAYSDFELEFNFWLRNTTWELDHVRLLEDGEEVGHTLLRVGAPMGMSYVCGEPIVIVNSRDGSTLTIGDYQVQPFRTEKVEGGREGDEAGKDSKPQPNSSCFGDSVHCGPYFTVPILSGLLVVGLMMGIVLTGITMLMNCNSNDRYDDPNGKAFVVKST